MFDWSAVKIYLYKKECDFRKSIDGLSFLISEAGLNPCDGSVYVFVNKAHDKFKAIYYDGCSYYMIYRRLNSGRFQWRLQGDDVIAINTQEMENFINGYPVQSTTIFPRKTPKFF